MSLKTLEQFVSSHVCIVFKTPYKQVNKRRGFVSHYYFGVGNELVLELQMHNGATMSIKAKDITEIKEIL